MAADADALGKQMGSVKRQRLDDGSFQFDLGSLKLALVDKLGVPAAALEPVESWDQMDALHTKFGFDSQDSFDARINKINALEKAKQIYVSLRDKHTQLYTKKVRPYVLLLLQLYLLVPLSLLMHDCRPSPLCFHK